MFELIDKETKFMNDIQFWNEIRGLVGPVGDEKVVKINLKLSQNSLLRFFYVIFTCCVKTVALVRLRLEAILGYIFTFLHIPAFVVAIGGDRAVTVQSNPVSSNMYKSKKTLLYRL